MLRDNNSRKFPVLFFILIAVLFSLPQAWAISAPSWNHLEVEETKVPDQINNARRFIITYFNKEDGNNFQVFPSHEEKVRDADLILAKAVWMYLEDEYHNQNKYMDEHVVSEANPGKIIDLVSGNYLSKAWNSDDVNYLRQYILKNKKNMLLYTLDVYLDYFVDKSEYFSGMDINPILLNLKESGGDEITFIMVNFSDK